MNPRIACAASTVVKRAALVAIVACCACTRCGSRDDVSGTYVVEGELNVEPHGKPPTQVRITGEPIVVTLTSRHYQNGSYEMTVRGCAMKANGLLVPASFEARSCTFDGPTGPFAVEAAFGSVTPAGGDDVDIRISGPLAGDGGYAGNFVYKVHGVPRR